MSYANKEVWKDIPNYESFYQVSNMGRVKGLDRLIVQKNGVLKKVKGVILKQATTIHGYKRVCLRRDDNKTMAVVHRLVMLAFKYNGKKKFVNHIDGNKTNNKLSNLEWCTPQENSQHAKVNKLMNNSYGSKNGATKLTESNVLSILEGASDGFTASDMAKYYGVTKATVLALLNGYTWSWCTGIEKRVRKDRELKTREYKKKWGIRDVS